MPRIATGTRYTEHEDQHVFWNSAYAVVSAGGHASIEQLVAYIQNQETPR